jgi:hypothetical protein
MGKIDRRRNAPYPPIIALLTDFGDRDGYVGSLKGVILGICPEARLVDITHQAPPRDVRAGAFILGSVYRDFPDGTIHLAVVDPGVGTERAALAVRTPRCTLVGPDNGIFSDVLESERDVEARRLENPAYWRPTVCPTFHGRDLFAPVAAHLASGAPFDLLGPPCAPTAPERRPSPKESAGRLEGEIIHIDRFGNAITDISRAELEAFAPAAAWTLRVGDEVISSLATTYGESAPGARLALIGSSGRLEIAVNLGSAEKELGLRRGELVVLSRGEPVIG